MGEFFIFAGPNGSGKSTLIYKILQKYPDLEYVNADYIAREHHEIRDQPEGADRDKAAWSLTNDILKKKLSSGNCSIVWETVFSDERRFEFIDLAKKNGFDIYLTYVTTINSNINVNRVQKRMSEGGHGVIPDKIEKRYAKSTGLIPKMINFVDEIAIFDNSRENKSHELVFSKSIINTNHTLPALYKEMCLEPRMVYYLSTDSEIRGWSQKNIIDKI